MATKAAKKASKSATVKTVPAKPASMKASPTMPFEDFVRTALAELLARAGGASNDSGAEPKAMRPRMVGPGPVILPSGAAVVLDEPIAADWQPSMESITFGSQGRFVGDPSNGDGSPEFPRRSPSGYPLQYGRTPKGLVGPGRIVWGGSTLTDEAELASNQAAVVQRSANLRRAMEQLAATPIVGASGVQAAQLLPDDLVYLRHVDENARFRMNQAGKLRNNVDVFRQLVSGSHDDINRAYDRAWHGTDVQEPAAQFKTNPEAWLARYRQSGNQALIRAYDDWISGATA